MSHESYLLVVILIMPVISLEWKQQELLKSFIHQNKSIDYIIPLFMKMGIARHILFMNLFASLRYWGNAFMVKPKTLENRLTV